MSYNELIKWAARTGRKAVNLYLTEETIAEIDRLRKGRTYIDPIYGRARPVGRARIVEELVLGDRAG